MKIPPAQWFRWLGLLSLSGGVAIAHILPAIAHPVADRTLGSESSVVTPTQTGRYDITGGAQRGRNLFHSFRDFRVRAGDRVLFRPEADVATILSRVTGGNPSEILGTLGVAGNANLFLLNPNGIVFGPNAQLNVSGSFVASTAQAMQFGDRGFFSATHPEPPGATLTINPSVFLFQQQTTQPITVRSRRPMGRDGLGLPMYGGLSARDVALLGGDIQLTGGIVETQGGSIILAGVKGNGAIGLRLTPTTLHLQSIEAATLADIRLQSASNLRIASAPSRLSGTITLHGDTITLNHANLFTFATEAAAGDILVQARNQATLMDSYLSTGSTNGDGGDVQMTAATITLRNTTTTSGGLFLNASGPGHAGSLVMMADHVILHRASIITDAFGTGRSGDISIQGAESVALHATNITNSNRTGSGGQVRLRSGGSVRLTDTRVITQSLGAGHAGGISVWALGDVQLGRTVMDSSSVAIADATAGNAGHIGIQAGNLILDHQSQLSTVANGAEGGDLSLAVREGLFLRRASLISTQSGVATGAGNGGNVRIEAGVVAAIASEDSDISAEAYAGRGGRIDIRTRSITGLAVRDERTTLSDITASSQFGIDGEVVITTPGVDPENGLNALPATPVDASRLVAESCGAIGARQAIAPRGGDFIITGRGGLPLSPHDPGSATAVQTDWAMLDGSPMSVARASSPSLRAASTHTTKHPPESSTQPMIEAQGWVRSTSGDIVLVAELPTPGMGDRTLYACRP